MQIFPFDTPFLLFGLCESETGNWKLENTMLLSQQRMKELLPFFQKFAETGELK